MEPLAAFPRAGLVVVFDRRGRVRGANRSRGSDAIVSELALVPRVREFLRGSSERVSFRTEDDREVRLIRLHRGRQLLVVAEIAPTTELTPGERLLTRAQREVARRAATGATLNEIARALDRSPETVRAHLREVYRRLDVATRIELMQTLTAKE